MDRPKIVSLKDPQFFTPIPELSKDAQDSLPVPVNAPSFELPLGETGLVTAPPADALKPLTVSGISPNDSSKPEASLSVSLPDKTVPVQPTVVLPEPVARPSGAPPWIERTLLKPEEKDDELVSELALPKVVSIQTNNPPRLVRAYEDQAARDLLPPNVFPQPLTLDQERQKAKDLAQKIHEDRKEDGVFSRIKRSLGFR